MPHLRWNARPSMLFVLATLAIMAAGPPSRLTPKQAQALVEGLGDESFPRREQATRVLRSRTGEALPALVRGMSHIDPEIRQRSAAILASFAPTYLRNRKAELFFDDLLPGRPVYSVTFSEKYEARDEDLAVIAGLPHLRRLQIWDASGVTEVGFGYLRHLRELHFLNIGGTVSDAVLARLGDLPALEDLMIYRGTATGAFFRNFRANSTLAHLQFDSTGLTDVGVEHVVRLANLKTMKLTGYHLTDRSLKAIAWSRSLSAVLIASSPHFTSAGVESLRRSSSLTYARLLSSPQLNRQVLAELEGELARRKKK